MNLAHLLLEKTRRYRKHIVVIGDTMTDIWIHGRTSGCQEGCLKFMEESRHTTPGGAANARHSIANWEVQASLFGQPDNDRPIKRRYVGRNNQVIFRDDDETMLERHTSSNYKWIHDFAMTAVRQCDGVLLSDYDKGFLTEEFIQEVVKVCHARNIPCVADCKREPRIYFGCILKGNLDWARKNNDATPDVLTRGGHLPCVQGRVFVGVSKEVLCINHVGAGDCFAAHMTLALACGFSLKEAATLAHSAGRVYVQFAHNRPPKPEEVAIDLESAQNAI